MDEQKTTQNSTRASIYITIGVCAIALVLGIWSATMNTTTNTAEVTKTTVATTQKTLKAVDENVTGVVESPTELKTTEKRTEAETKSTTKSYAASYFVMPVEGVAEVIKKYSAIQLQFSETYGDWRIHTAIDIKGKDNSRINSSGNGKVTNVTEDKTWGKIVEIDHGKGVVARYCGLSETNVEKGDSVESGDKIGRIGTPPCEFKDGVHLHLEMKKDGKPVDPLTLMKLE